jgi:bifunctional non-homologous end joining protein LigD
MEQPARKKQKRSPRSAVTISNPDKVLFPDDNVTKHDLVDYWTAVAPHALPWISDRPLSLLRCPGGVSEECFYQKHIAEGFPEPVGRVPVNDDGDLYATVGDLDGLLGLAQMNVIEVHNWGSTAVRLDQPDMIVFDLDPAENVSWSTVVEAAFELKDRLESLGLTPFPKLTGGKGIHLVVPVVPGPDWSAVKHFAKAVAREMESAHPYKYTTNMSKAKRVDKIFIDYLRNDREATSIAPYSPRARPGATVAVPVTWSDIELSAGKQLVVAVKNVSAWLETHPDDQWKTFDAARTRLTG